MAKRFGFTPEGREIPDPTPVEIPAGVRIPPTIQEMIRMYIREDMSRQAYESGEESFEEADDFDVDDEGDLFTSPYEIPEGAPEWIGGVKDADAAPPPDPRVPEAVKSAPDKVAPRAAGKPSDPSSEAEKAA